MRVASHTICWLSSSFNFYQIFIRFPLSIITFENLQNGTFFTRGESTVAHVKLLRRTISQELNLLKKQLHIIGIRFVVTNRRVSGIAKEGNFAARGFVANSQHQRTFGVAAGNWLYSNLQTIFENEGRLHSLNASASTNRFITMAESFAAYVEVVKMDARQIEGMIPMEMGNDNIFLEKNAFRVIRFARQIVHKIHSLVAGAHIENPPGRLTTNGVHIGAKRPLLARA